MIETETPSQMLTSVGMCNRREAIEEGDIVVVHVGYGTMYSVKVTRGQTLAMKKGALRHEFLIGKKWGTAVEATAGFVTPMRPSPELWTRCLPHHTQIIYTPDIAAIVIHLELRPGVRLCESGAGSGSLTHALCRAVQPSGHVYSYDIEEDRVESVRGAVQQHGFDTICTLRVRDVCTDGFDIDGKVTAVFLDLPTPWRAISFAVDVLDRTQPCRIACFSPCIEQVQQNCAALRQHNFVNIETLEVQTQSYKSFNVAVTSDDGDEYQQMQLGICPRTQPTHTSFMTFATLPTA